MADGAAQSRRPAPIALLDESTIAGIAAGEVVERPASAVKELVENCLDAGARQVRVDYEDAGALRIVVTDDGVGIPESEVALALTRHATSKIRSLGDLDAVGTFGFRGEALAAIASASELEMVTAVEGSPAGTRVLVKAGRIVEQAPAPARRGTRIDVRDLFAAVPARRKFLKSAAAEAGFVADVVRRFALVRPDVHFVLTSGGRTVLDAPAVPSAAERVRQVLGREVAASLVEVDARLGELRLVGFASSPGTSFGTSRRMAIYVGGRWVREKLLFQAVLEGYRTYLLRGRYPAVCLALDCGRGGVDVNVHPSKLEVRFPDPGAVSAFVAEAVRDSLRRSASPLGRWGLAADEALRRRAVPGAVAPRPEAPPTARDAAASAAVPASVASASAASSSDVAAQAQGGAPVRGAAPAGEGPREAPASLHAPGTTADLGIPGYAPAAVRGPSTGAHGDQGRLDLGASQAVDALGRFAVVGQIFEGYFVCEGDGEVWLVDQHAAHERILFERLMEGFASREVARQALLIPEQVAVGAQGVAACVEGAAQLEAMGWEVEPFGDEHVVVRAMPAMAGRADPRALVEAVAADLVQAGSARAAGRLVERVMATVACHSAVRVGKRLDASAARALLAEMATVSYHSTCPHGRPVARKLPRGQVERLFGR